MSKATKNLATQIYHLAQYHTKATEEKRFGTFTVYDLKVESKDEQTLDELAASLEDVAQACKEVVEEIDACRADGRVFDI